jgi:hypothetical protein
MGNPKIIFFKIVVRDVVAHLGDVVAQLAKATGRHHAACPPQSPERGQDIWLCII